MARLPIPGADAGNWGAILNDYLLQSHDAEGSLSNYSVNTTQLHDGAVTLTKLVGSVQSSLSKADTALQPGDVAASPVDSVNNKTGAVVLTSDDISDTNSFNKYTSSAEKSKLAAIASAATANDTDANLKNRSNHTGTQTAATISDFSAAADARITAANKKTDQMSTGKLLGRGGAGTGAIEEITLGNNLSLSGTTLNATAGGAGDVVGPGSSVDNAIARFDGTTGKLIQGSGPVIDDNGNIGIGQGTPTARLDIRTTTFVGERIYGNATETANLQEWKSNTGSTDLYVDPKRRLVGTAGSWVKNSFLAPLGEGVADMSMTGMYDRNELANAGWRGNITVNVTGAGTFTDTRDNKNNLVSGNVGIYFQIAGTDATTTQIQFIVDTGRTNGAYGSAKWQPFLQMRTAMAASSQTPTFYNAIVAEYSLDGATYYKPTDGSWETTDAAAAQFPASYWMGGIGSNTLASWRYVRFTLTDRVEQAAYASKANVWIVALGFRHASAPWSRAYVGTAGTQALYPGDSTKALTIYDGNIAETLNVNTTAKLVEANALNITSSVTSTKPGLTFGADVNLYRSAANVLATDDNLLVNNAAGITINTGAGYNTALTENNLTFNRNAASYISQNTTGGNLQVQTRNTLGDTMLTRLTVTGGDTGSVQIGNANLNLSEGTGTGNVVTGTTTGSMIGTSATQKIGFWGSTPVVQPAVGAELIGSLQSVGLRASGSTAVPITTSGAITMTGSFRLGVAVHSATVSLNTGYGPFQNINATSGAINVTLPATTTVGLFWVITKVDATANPVTLIGTIDGVANYTLYNQGDFLIVQTTSTSGAFTTWGQDSLRFGATTLTSATTLNTNSVPNQDCNATSAAFNVTLPATTNAGYEYTFIKTDNSVNAVTILGTINGATNYVLTAQYKHVTVRSTTTSGAWLIKNSN